MEIHGHVTAVTRVVEGDETTVDVAAGETLIPVADVVDFHEDGGTVRIDGEIYDYVTMDDGEESGVPSITLATPLVADVDEATQIELWNTNTGKAIAEWKATVSDDLDGSSIVAPLSHTLIDKFLDPNGDLRGIVGESVVARTDEAGEWTVVEVYGKDPEVAPEFIRTGGLGADTVVWAGTEDGRRAQLDGIDGAVEAFNDDNVQTVNLDGHENYVTGTLATAPTGDTRVEVGPGLAFDRPTNEVRFHSEHADEVEPAKIWATVSDIGGGEFVGAVTLSGPEWDGEVRPPSVGLNSGGPYSQATIDATRVTLSADYVLLQAPEVVVDGQLDANMRDGEVGSGGFRDSVDARVTTLAQPVDATLTALAGQTVAADQVIYATGADAFAVTSFTSLARTLAAVTTVANFRTAILAKDKRPGVNTQTANYTIAASDEDVRVQINNAAARTVTLPSDTTAPTLPTNFECSVTRLGAGAVTFVADTGVTIDSRGALLGINGQYGVVNIKKRAANRWIIWGDLV